jgi:hypothetical protein
LLLKTPKAAQKGAAFLVGREYSRYRLLKITPLEVHLDQNKYLSLKAGYIPHLLQIAA